MSALGGSHLVRRACVRLCCIAAVAGSACRWGGSEPFDHVPAKARAVVSIRWPWVVHNTQLRRLVDASSLERRMTEVSIPSASVVEVVTFAVDGHGEAVIFRTTGVDLAHAATVTSGARVLDADEIVMGDPAVIDATFDGPRFRDTSVGAELAPFFRRIEPIRGVVVWPEAVTDVAAFAANAGDLVGSVLGGSTVGRALGAFGVGRAAVITIAPTPGGATVGAGILLTSEERASVVAGGAMFVTELAALIPAGDVGGPSGSPAVFRDGALVTFETAMTWQQLGVR